MRPLFLNDIQINRSIGLDLFVFAAIVAISLQRIHETFFRNRNKLQGEVFHKQSITYLTIIHVLSILLSYVEYIYFRSSINYILLMIGAAFYGSALLVRLLSIRELGRLHSIHIEVRKDHPIIQSGPYKYVRHPIYAVTILELFSVPLITNSLSGAAIVAFFYLPGLCFRAQAEDKILVAELGEPYKEYSRRTPLIFPNIRMKRK